jgi:hypothetical protein
MQLDLDKTKQILAANAVPRRFYILPGDFDPSERYGIRHNGSQWEVFYSERGEHNVLFSSESEDAACRFFLDKIDKSLKAFEGRSLQRTW